MQKLGPTWDKSLIEFSHFLVLSISNAKLLETIINSSEPLFLVVFSVAPFILDLYSRAALALIFTRNFSGVGLFLHRCSHTAASYTTWLDSNDLSWFGLGIFAPFDPNRLGGSDGGAGNLLLLNLTSTSA